MRAGAQGAQGGKVYICVCRLSSIIDPSRHQKDLFYLHLKGYIVSGIWTLSHKIKRSYYRLRRLANETVFVSIPSYKKADVNERQDHYRKEVELIIRNASKHASPFPEPTERLENYEYALSLTDVSSDILKQVRDGKIIYYRGMLPAYVPFFRELYGTGILQSLAEAGRVAKIKPTNFYTDDYSMIIEVETLHVVNPVFWSFSMIRESVINLLLIDDVLKEIGYGVIDGHPFNSAFKDGRPVMFDIGSFVKRQECQFAGELIHYPLSTLLMLSTNRSHFGRHNIFSMNVPLLSAAGKGISIEKQALYRTFFRYHKKNSSRGYNAILSEVFNEKRIRPEYVDILFAKRLETSTALEGETKPGITDPLTPTDTITKIVQLVRRFSPDAKSSLDLAGGSGGISYHLSTSGQFESVITLDYDENVVEYGIARLKDKRVTFYHVDPFFPFGEREPFAASVRSDVVLLPGVTPHLILSLKYKIHAILSIVRMYANRHVYIEFYPLGNTSGESLPALPAWYTEEWFEEKFRSFFTLLHKEVLQTVNIDGKEKTLRTIFVGEKINR